MPRYYPNGKRCQINLAIDVDAYRILETLAPSKRAYGHVVSQMLRDLSREAETDALVLRVQRLEEHMTQK